MEMNKRDIEAFAKEASAALEALAKKHGVAIAYKGARYSKTTCLYKWEVQEIGEGGIAKTREAAHFEEMAHLYDLQAEDLGRSFSMDGERYTVAGLATRAPKYPILASRSDGRTFKFTPQSVKRSLAAERR